MKDLYIIGAGSVGGHIASNWNEFHQSYQLKGFLDDNSLKHGFDFCGLPVLGGVDFLKTRSDSAVIIGIAFPLQKLKIKRRLVEIGDFHFPTLISPRSWVSKNVEIGEGTIVYPGTSVNYGSQIGDFVVVNMNCAIGHDVSIGDFSSLAPGVNLGGNTKIGSAVEMGIGSATKQFVKIHDHCVIGGQSMIINDIEENSTVVGVPGKPQKIGLSIK